MRNPTSKRSAYGSSDPPPLASAPETNTSGAFFVLSLDHTLPEFPWTIRRSHDDLAVAHFKRRKEAFGLCRFLNRIKSGSQRFTI